MSENSPSTSSRILLFALSIYCFTMFPACRNQKETAKPNILFIMSDDHTTQAIGVYGSRLSPLDPTPNLDQLASEGLIFDHMFCTNSICTPSRATIITGQYSETNGVLDLMGHIPPSKQYLPIEIKKLGYQTAMIGKWHLVEEPAAFDYYNVLPGQGKYFNPPTLEKGKGDWRNNITEHIGHSSDVITDISLEWLKTRDKGRPFFLMHHFKAPHDLFSNAERYDSYLSDVEIPEPESLFNTGNHGSVSTRGNNDSLMSIIGASVSRRCNAWGFGNAMNIEDSLTESEYTHAVYQEFLKRYLRCVKGVDDNLKRIIDFLKEEGIYDETVIFYTGDQGYFLGEHDYFDKRWMYEESMRMPLIVRFPSKSARGDRSDILINNTDLAPTMIEIAGGNVPEYMQGISFINTLVGKNQNIQRQETYYRYWMHMAHNLGTPAHFGLRTKQYKLIFFYGVDYENPPRTDYWGSQADIVTPPGWEFYDLFKDPLEMDNQYNNPAYKEIIANLKTRLLSIREELNETDKNYPHIQNIIDTFWE